MGEAIRIDIASPPDRDRLVAQIVVGNEQWAELNQEGDRLVLEIYPRRDGTPWSIDYEAAMHSLVGAREKLGTDAIS